MHEIFDDLLQTLLSYEEKLMKFKMYRKEVKPPRIYLQSDSDYFNLMRQFALPNISYLSILKLKKS